MANLLSVLEESGFRPHLLAEAVLQSFRGLVVEPVNRQGPGFLNGEPLYLEAGGRMVADDSGQIIELGTTFEEGVEHALLAPHPLVVLHESTSRGSR